MNLRFLIIGAERSGSTSLFEYIIRHKDFKRPLIKEIEFFDRNYEKGLAWYEKHFLPVDNRITGEATPGYYFHPKAPERIKRYSPNTKLIMIMRNPVDQVYSKYWQQRKRNDEYVPTFEEAIKIEPCRVEGSYEEMFIGGDAYTFRRFAYLERGKYAKYIKRWLEIFTRNQFIFLQFEKVFADPENHMKKVYEFLGLDFQAFEFYPQHNSSGGYMEMDSKTREKLVDYFKPENEKLYKLIGERFDWSRSGF